jgi:predicted transcriptional regulator
MTAESERTKLMRRILEASVKGLTKQEMLDTSGLSYQQLRDITAELADKEFLRYNESDDSYMTTDKGYIFLKDVRNGATKEKSFPK